MGWKGNGVRLRVGGLQNCMYVNFVGRVLVYGTWTSTTITSTSSTWTSTSKRVKGPGGSVGEKRLLTYSRCFAELYVC